MNVCSSPRDRERLRGRVGRGQRRVGRCTGDRGNSQREVRSGCRGADRRENADVVEHRRCERHCLRCGDVDGDVVLQDHRWLEVGLLEAQDPVLRGRDQHRVGAGETGARCPDETRRRGANRTVDTGDDLSDDSTGRAERRCACVEVDLQRTAIPLRAGDDVVAAGQRHHAAHADMIEGPGANEAVAGGDGARRGGNATRPRHCARPGDAHGVPAGAADDVVAIGQRRDAAASHIVAEDQRAVGRCRADQAVARSHGAGCGRNACGPGDRADVRCWAVPERAADDVAPVRQRGHTVDADMVEVGTADETVRRAHLTDEADGSAGPGCCSDLDGRAVAPERTEHDEVAVRQRGHTDDADGVAGTDVVRGDRSDEAVGRGHDCVRDCRAIRPGDRADICG